jgi:hypothetical protein
MSEPIITKEEIEAVDQRRRQEAERIFNEALAQIRALGCDLEAVPVLAWNPRTGALVLNAVIELVSK